jgi:Flp pilus assembly protein TadG
MNKRVEFEMHVRHRVSQEQGVIAIVAALSLVALLGFVALIIDLGFGLVTRNQLQNIADGASLAGARQLSRIYEGLTPTERLGYTLTSGAKSAILAEVREIGEKNAAGGKSISINTEDIVIGQWDITQKDLTPTDASPDAVRVLARRDDQANSPLTTFFAGLVGIPSLNVSARAAAALTGIKEVFAGELNAPFGISRVWFENHGEFCDQPVQFSPTNSPEGCAGWHTFFDTPNTKNLQRILDGLRTGTFTSPEATAGTTQFNFIGGALSSVFSRFRALYEAKAVCATTGALCSAGSCDGPCEWSTFVGVYDAPDCSNPNTALTIVGFATATIDQVENHDKIIRGRVECHTVQPNARGGGALFGTKGSLPGLVQ